MNYPKFASCPVALVALAATAKKDFVIEDATKPVFDHVTFTLVKLPPKPPQGEH